MICEHCVFKNNRGTLISTAVGRLVLMALIQLRNITLGHTTPPLIENGNLTINSGEHVCLIGRNGVGKSTLLQLIQGSIEVDGGTVDRSATLTTAYLTQDVPPGFSGKVVDIVTAGLNHEDIEDWNIQHRVEKVLSKLSLSGDLEFKELSGGLQRQVLLAKAIVSEPDLLLLDEPTNHLDIESIQWLEKYLLSFKKTFILITHDRALMQRVATHIVEIDNGQFISWRGHYHDYLKLKQSKLEAGQQAESLFDKRLAQEEVWIRQGIKARRTRNEGRVRSLKKMREQRAQRRYRPGQVQLTQQDPEISGKIVFEADQVSYHYPTQHQDIIHDFSTLILRGDKIGFIGANGSGKTTLINLLLGNLSPNSGDVKHGTQLNVAYVDQNRKQLDENKSVIDNISEGSQTITIGNKSKHVISYLQDFLFSPERARTPVKILSGGERNRVLLAKALSKPCNVLVLDEPTNDLDLETIELLEDYLSNFNGTLLLISHDREFLNNVVTSTLVMEGQGKVGEYVGGFDDWIRQRKQLEETQQKLTIETKSQKPKLAKKLSYKEQRELDELPSKIENLEQLQQQLQTKLSNPKFYKDNPNEIPNLKQQLEETNTELETALKRWEDLESRH